MNKIIVSGNICRDFEVAKKSNFVVANSSIAVYNGKDKDGNAQSIFFDLKVFGEYANKMTVHKGDKVIVFGRLSRRDYNDKTYVEIIVESIEKVKSSKTE